MNNLAFIGDIHGHFKDKNDSFGRQIRNSYLSDMVYIQCGDFGLGFESPHIEKHYLEKLNEDLKKKNSKLYAIRGNHDDPKLFTPEHSYKFSNIEFLPDYTSLELCGHKILFVGGAISVDRIYRVEGKSYWKDEPFVLLEDFQSKISDHDIVVTHSAPVDFYPNGLKAIRAYLIEDHTLENDLILERNKLNELYYHLIPSVKYWFYGHFHGSHQEYHNSGQTKAILLNIDEFYYFNDYK